MMTFVVSSPIGKLLALARKAGGISRKAGGISRKAGGISRKASRSVTPFGGCLVSLQKIHKQQLKLDKTYSPLLQKIVQRQFQQYQSGCLTRFKIPLAKHGTIFQQKVWKAISKIPYGQVRSYQWVATQIGHALAVRAVGSACAKNPFPIIVPCHRVVAKTHIGGYLYGVKAKQKLLQLEKNYIKQNKPLALSSKNR